MWIKTALGAAASASDSVNGIILVVLAIAGLITVVPIFLMALGALRDEIVAQGWVSRESRIGKMVLRSETAKTIPVLQAIGLDAHAENAIRAAANASQRRPRSQHVESVRRPDIAFLERAKEWIYELEPPYDYKGSSYYLDMMGAIDGRQDHQESIDQIFQYWIDVLINANVVSSFDVLLAPKDGNVLLCREVAKRLNKPLILCKGERDRALVHRPETRMPHETDFEGFRAFCDLEAAKVRHPDRKYSALLIDDSCSNGSQLVSAANRFNLLITSQAVRSQVVFENVQQCVVLFRAVAGNTSIRNFESAQVSLHALVAVGPDQLARLKNGRPGAREVETFFKLDEFSCKDSASILHS